MFKQKFHFNTIRNKFVAFFLIASFFPFLLLSGASWYNYQKNINQNTLSYVKQLMSTSTAGLNDFFNKLTNYYYSVYSAQLPNLLPSLGTNSLKEVKAKIALSKLIKELQIFYNLPADLYVSIISENGEILYQNNSVRTENYLFTDSEPFKEFLHSNRANAVLPSEEFSFHVETPADASYISYMQKIKTPDPSGSQYIFLIDFNATELDTLLAPLVLGNDSELYLTYNHEIVYSKNTDKNILSDMQQILNTDTGEPFFVQKKIRNQEYLLAKYTLRSTQLSVMSANALPSIFKDTPNLAVFSLILALTSMLLSFLLARYFSIKLTNPIRILKEKTYEVTNGNLQAHIPPLGNDEIGELGVCINKMLCHIQTLIQEKYEFELREKEFQIQTLQAQIHPHFLYNTLETISCFAENEGIDSISTIAMNLADLYRYSINASNKLVPLSEELENIQNYLSIMKIRYTDRLKTIYNIDESTLDTPIMKLTLQPIIENAIYHGLENIRTDGCLSINVTKEGDHVNILISDNGAGMNPQQLNDLRLQLHTGLFNEAAQRTKHIGIGNVYYRLKLRFGDKCRMKIDSVLGKGTSVSIILPLPGDTSM